MNVVHKKSPDNQQPPEIDKNTISGVSTRIHAVINNTWKQSKELLEKNKKTANEENISNAIDDKILKSQYFTIVNNVYRDLQDLLIEHWVEPLVSEQNVFLNDTHRYWLIQWLESSDKLSDLWEVVLRKMIIKYIAKNLTYVDERKLAEVMHNKLSTYQWILLEIKMQKDKSTEHEKLMVNKRSYREALELYEALHPIERRLKNITAFINAIKDHQDLVRNNKEIQAHLCTRIAENNKDKIKAIFNKLKSDKENLAELEKDQKIILALEKEIVDAAKRSLSFYIQHMHVLYKDKFTREEHDEFRERLQTKVTNSETLEDFRRKFFDRLVKLWIRKLKKKAKNHWVRLQKK